jgi:tryptophanyl-tRNA synthetase
MTNKRFLSGITPSGDGTLHIGNYLGAVAQFIELSQKNEAFLMVADLHALTTIQEKKQLEKNVETLILSELALLKGFMDEEKFKKIVFFRQSDVPEHAELQTILNNVTPLGLLKRAHAYKDKLQNQDASDEEINLGLFNYPILMAADILLYKPQFIPVGKDQKQHIEIARDLAERFNKTFGKNIFVLPEPQIPEETAVIMGTDGKRKMSKSLGNIIAIFEPEEVIKKQVMSCYTDPTRAHTNDPGHVEGNMVFSYLDFFGERQTVDEYKEAYRQGRVADVEIKDYLFAALMKTFRPARDRYEELKANPKLVKEILEHGTYKAREAAGKTMVEVREAVGLNNSYAIGSSLIVDRSSKNNNCITIEDIAKLEVRVGKVVKAENVEKSDKLILLTVSFGEAGQRTIYTGVRGYGYTPEDFAGKQFFFVVNLKPRKMPGGESQGMILAVDSEPLPFGKHGATKPLFVSAEGLPVGARIR